MKVYSWKTLLATILIGGGGLISSAIRWFSRGDLAALFTGILCCGLIIRGLPAALTEEGYKKYIEDAERYSRAYRTRFGKLTPIAVNGFLIFMVVGVLLMVVFPWQMVIGFCVMLAGLFYQAWLAGVIDEDITKQKEAEKEIQEG